MFFEYHNRGMFYLHVNNKRVCDDININGIKGYIKNEEGKVLEYVNLLFVI